MKITESDRQKHLPDRKIQYRISDQGVIMSRLLLSQTIQYVPQSHRLYC